MRETRAVRRFRLVEWVAFSLLSLLMLGQACLRHGTQQAVPVAPVIPQPPHTPSEAARRAAWGWRKQAIQRVNGQREGLQLWDPAATMRLQGDDWRLQQLARDYGGYLHRARQESRKAAALARTPDETQRAAALTALIEHELGEHRKELQQARLLMALAPRSRTALASLWRAAECNRLTSLARQAHARLQSLEHSSVKPLGQGNRASSR